MVTGFLHGTLVFKHIVFKIFILLSLFLTITNRAYAAPWFTTYGAGVLSGYDVSGDYSVVTIQPFFAAPPANVFTSTLVQPGNVSPILMSPDHNTYDFSYGGILSSGDYEVKTGVSDTIDAFAKNIGGLGDSLPDYQSFLRYAEVLPSSCDITQLFTCDDLLPGKFYEVSSSDINLSLNTLSGASYNMGGASGGLFIFVVNDTPPASTITIQKNIPSNSTSERLVIITSGKVDIRGGVGNVNTANQALYITQDADVQVMFISTFGGDSDISLDSSSNPIKVEGPMIAKGKISIKKQLAVTWPPVFIQFNPFYTTELAKLDKSPNIFGPSTARWSYE